MKFAIALLVIALFGGAFAQEKDNRATLFVEGVSVGVTADMGNVTECTKDLVLSLDSFDKALPAMKAGMLTANRDLVKSAVATFGAGVEEVSKAFTVCAVFATAESTDILASSMKGENTADFFAGLLSEKDTVEDLSAAVKYLEAGDSFSAGVYTGRVINVLLEKTLPKTGGALNARAYFA